ncbi:HNH endonuclease signature motif containing protein [Jiella sonneratiae]|uniref:HNH endonuclease n=1 Tax=Jiella sonneratiae TaxID=2816856 RepID=A0ABS3J7F7_9HYPH|nr:HNH endonuclease [Jiella sonneratiae]
MKVRKEVRALVLERDHWRCYLCGRRTTSATGYPLLETAATIDHVDPRYWKNRNEAENLRCSCQRCNRAKGGRHVWFFISFWAYPDAGVSDERPCSRRLTPEEMGSLWRHYMFDGDEPAEPWGKPPHPLLAEVIDPDYL